MPDPRSVDRSPREQGREWLAAAVWIAVAALFVVGLYAFGRMTAHYGAQDAALEEPTGVGPPPPAR